MANSLFDKGREGFLDGTIDWDTDNIKVHIIDETDDTPNLATDNDLADRTAAAIVATSGNLGTKSVTDGTADAADVTLSSVTGDACDSIEGYQDTGDSATSRMIFNIDTATGLPVTPNGGDITIQWNASGIFTL